MDGKKKSFVVEGQEGRVTYIPTTGGSGLTDDDVAEIGERWGNEAADKLVIRDFGSIKFNSDVLAANYEDVVAALQVLRSKVLESLFKPMLMKAAPNALDMVKKYAKTPEEVRELLRQLKITFQLR